MGFQLSSFNLYVLYRLIGALVEYITDVITQATEVKAGKINSIVNELIICITITAASRVKPFFHIP